MYLVWHRWGILAIVIPVVGLIAVQLGVDAIGGDGYYKQTQWPKLLGIILSSVAVGGVGFLLNRRNTRLQSKHRFFWVPLEYWGPLMLAFGLWIEFTR